MSNLVYLLALAVVYLYTNGRGSVGLLWALVFVLFQLSLSLVLTIPAVLNTAAASGILLVVFELLLFIADDPFSRPRVFAVVSTCFKGLASVLALVGIKPRARLINVHDSASVRQVYIQLQAERWDKVEQQLLALPDGARYQLINGLAGVPRRPPVFDEWLAARPMSALPGVVSAQQRLAAAWQVRGTGAASTVTPKRQQTFIELLRQARADLERAVMLDATLCDSYVGMLTVVMGTSGERKQLWDAFAKARVHAENHYQAHMAMVTAMSPQWGGEPGEALGFGRITARQAPADSALPGILAVAHIENWLQLDSSEKDFESGMYFRQSAVLKELNWAYQRLQPSRTMDADLIAALNAFAFSFYLGGQYDVTREILQLLDGRYCDYPWCYCSEPFLATVDIGFAIDQVEKVLQQSANKPQRALST